MKRPAHTPTLYLIRHASPDWSRTDIPYDVPPGPDLTPKGREEAQALGVFLRVAGVKKLYYSPLERSARTAQIAAAVAQVPAALEDGLAEWRNGETETEIHERFWPLVEAGIEESARLGPLGLVTHGGPVAYLLKRLGMDPDLLAQQRRLYDRANPLPPAGAWAARKNAQGTWELELAFTPGEVQ